MKNGEDEDVGNIMREKWRTLVLPEDIWKICKVSFSLFKVNYLW